MDKGLNMANLYFVFTCVLFTTVSAFIGQKEYCADMNTQNSVDIGQVSSVTFFINVWFCEIGECFSKHSYFTDNSIYLDSKIINKVV